MRHYITFNGQGEALQSTSTPGDVPEDSEGLFYRELPEGLAGRSVREIYMTEAGAVAVYSEEVCARRAVPPHPGAQWDRAAMAWNDLRAEDQQAADAAQVQRAQRDALLAASDWTVVADSPLTPARKAKWVAYRKLLRDITDQEGFPFTVKMPVPPT